VKNERWRLVAPAEPLAWAIGTEERGVFTTTWHSERTPGARPIPAALEAHVPRQRGLAVRVFGDDGSVGAWSPRPTAKGAAKAAEVTHDPA
jgi:hypothetical protein